MIRYGKARPAYEELAHFIIQSEFSAKNLIDGPARRETAILTAEPHVIKSISDFAKGVGCSFYIVPDDA